MEFSRSDILLLLATELIVGIIIALPIVAVVFWVILFFRRKHQNLNPQSWRRHNIFKRITIVITILAVLSLAFMITNVISNHIHSRSQSNLIKSEYFQDPNLKVIASSQDLSTLYVTQSYLTDTYPLEGNASPAGNVINTYTGGGIIYEIPYNVAKQKGLFNIDDNYCPVGKIVELFLNHTNINPNLPSKCEFQVINGQKYYYSSDMFSNDAKSDKQFFFIRSNMLVIIDIVYTQNISSGLQQKNLGLFTELANYAQALSEYAPSSLPHAAFQPN